MWMKTDVDEDRDVDVSMDRGKVERGLVME